MAEPTNVANIGAVRRNDRQELRLFVGDFYNHPYIYCRVYELEPPPPGAEERHPGLTLRPEHLRELLPMFNQALDVAEMRQKAAYDDQEPEERRRRRR